MNEDLKRNPDKAFMHFTRVYVYITNTKKPWDELKDKEMKSKKFKWNVSKWFCVSKNKLKREDLIKHFEECPEIHEKGYDGINKRQEEMFKKPKGWKHQSLFFHIYESRPLEVYDLKLLIECLGLRMTHFVKN